ncbi:hypothetical protein ACVWWR_005102 [Bradyrhizobium sp. LM3.2]
MAIEMVQIFGDGRRLRDQGAVIEFEHRDFPRGVDREKRRLLVLCPDQIDADELDPVVESLFGKDDANARGIGKSGPVVDFHENIPLSIDR